MPTQTIPFTTLKIPGLIEVHNVLASERGVPKLRAWHDTRCKLAEKVAILRTIPPRAVPPTPANDNIPKQQPPKQRKRKAPLRQAIMRALEIVSHYEHAKTGEVISKHTAWRRKGEPLISVGLPYPDVLKRVKREFPKAKVACRDLRWTAAKVREGAAGFEKCKLPQKRPHGSQKGK